MPPGAVWTLDEEISFIQFLVDHKAGGADNGTFKGTTFQQATAHIAHLRKSSAVKGVKSLQNKWTALRKTYHMVQAIQSVSGWVWDQDKGANINADTASSWDDYVKKHPMAKPFRNKGWVHFAKVNLIMPSTVAGANVFHPTQDTVPEEEEDSDQVPNSPVAAPAQGSQSSDDDEDEPIPPPCTSGSRKCAAHEPATPTRPISKHARCSNNSRALENMSTSLCEFSTTIATALNGPSSSRIDPTPVWRTAGVKAMLELEKEWLTEEEIVALIDFLRLDQSAADTYMALTESSVRHRWVSAQLRELDV